MDDAEVATNDGSGGITRSWADGSYVYAVEPGKEQHPFRFGDYYAACGK